MPEGLITVAYIVSAVLFILSLRGLSNQETTIYLIIFETFPAYGELLEIPRQCL